MRKQVRPELTVLIQQKGPAADTDLYQAFCLTGMQHVGLHLNLEEQNAVGRRIDALLL